MEIEKLQQFTAKFFENLRCTLSWDGKVLTVNNVPESFEKFSNKKGPYFLVFEEKYGTIENEIINPTSPILNAMKRFLQNTGTTTLLKLDFNNNPIEIIKNRLTFENCDITELKKSTENNFFYRFTFHTNFHYLNEKEQIINEVYVHNNEIVQGNLAGYPVSEGKKEEVSAQEIKKNYELAKKEITPLIENKTKEISESLNNKLEQEIGRITIHFNQIKKEINEKINTESQKLNFLKNQLKFSPEREKPELLKKIDKIEKTIEKVKEDNDFYKIEKDEEFTIKDEKHKHSLNIDNKLINTTVIYYPIFTYILIFDKKLKKQLKVIYNPLTQLVEPIRCSECDKEIKKIEMCSNGHVLCSKCARVCKDCGDTFCDKCLRYNCEICKKELCTECKTQCPKCGKYFCKNHMRRDNLTEEIGCTNCLKTCPKCRTCSEPRYFKKNSEGISICSKCASKEISKNISKQITKDIFG